MSSLGNGNRRNLRALVLLSKWLILEHPFADLARRHGKTDSRGLDIQYPTSRTLESRNKQPTWACRAGATGQDIITFVIHVATAKNEPDKVVIGALSSAARIPEGRVAK